MRRPLPLSPPPTPTQCFPCISTGVNGYPVAEAADIAVRSVREWLEEGDNAAAVRVVFCLLRLAALCRRALSRFPDRNSHALCTAAWRVVSCRVVSCRVVSCRVVSCRVVSCRDVSCRVVPCPCGCCSLPHRWI
jgi:hypothetical protein